MILRGELWIAWSVLIVLLAATLIAAWRSDAPSAPLANALLLTLAATVSAWVLVRQIGEWAPLFVATCVFASMLGVSVFSAGLDVLLLTSTALGLAIVFRFHAPAETHVKEIYGIDLVEKPSRRMPRWALAGALLAMSIGANPANALILLASLAGVPRSSGQRERVALLLGGIVGGFSGLLLCRAFGGSNPEIALATDQIYRPELVEVLSSPGILLRGLFELGFGRHIGLFVAFFPLVFCLAGYERSSTRLRGALLLAGVAILVLPVVYRPFDFWLGESAPASASRELVSHTLLPIYPVFWFIGSRVVRPWQAAAVALVSLFLMGQAWAGAWLRPAAPQLARHVSAVAATPFARAARGFLPVETSQRALLLSGLPDRLQGELWLRRLNHLGEVGGVGESSVLQVKSDRSSTFLIASERPLDTLVLRVVGDPAPSSIGLDGGEIEQIMFEPRGAVRFEIGLDPEVAHHPSWWSKPSLYFYELRLLLPSGGLEEGGVFEIEMEPGALLEKGKSE